MRTPSASIVLAAAIASLAGCQAISGLQGSTPRFACKAPDGVTCTSVSGVYANLEQRARPPAQPSLPTAAAPNGHTLLPLAPARAGQPLRSEPRVLRIWIAPWIDDEGTLHDQSYLYTQIDAGRWLIGEVRKEAAAPALRRADPVAAPGSAPGAAPVPDTAHAAAATANSGQRLMDVRGNATAQAAARATATTQPNKEPR
ncbi:conjugal transfer pilus assembly protein TraV [Pseudoduganella lurida]|uniref:Conjugal transfer pilus assembly protein TraV n=1 Tax=Pseudoduganella lurida TaxID=1036180 RepID=A0A562RJV3_9BURK|nr:type IV conjugative transfer system lipoprotein TraV [Pseudoduganella lurida]TWI69291.1 conjugal transfer pilus assembly protein TraV [Pseudoduganella lurida]